MSKGFAGFAMALGSTVLVTGCHSTKSSQATVYSQPAGGTGSGTSSALSGSSASSGTSTQLMQGELSIPLYEEQIQVGTRVVETGAVRLRKQVTSETVNQPVQVRHETLVVDREAAPPGQAPLKEPGTTKETGTSEEMISTPFAQGEILIRLYREEPVVEKRIVPSGRIVAQTRTNTEQVTVQRDLRREKIDVEKIGNPQNVTISEKVGERSKKEAVGGTGTGSEQIKGGQKQPEDQKQQEDRKAGEP
jgi:uncharacterized protein (TIGR02271 family)